MREVSVGSSVAAEATSAFCQTLKAGGSETMLYGNT